MRSHPLHYQFLSAGGCGFLALWLLVAFWPYSLLFQLVFGLGFLHPQHRQFLLPPANFLAIKIWGLGVGAWGLGLGA